MKTLITLIFLACSSVSQSQIKNVYGEYQLTGMAYKEDTLRLKFPLIISLTDYGRTPIISVGRIGGTYYGIRLELLKSNVGLKEEVILGKAFFAKDIEGEWKEIYAGVYNKKEIILSNPSPLPEVPEWATGSEGGPDFTCWYKEAFFIY
jgi:hypothetical protein